MTISAFPGVRQFPTHHCITGTLRHIYDWAGYEISEEMLLGIGAGVGFSYWHFKGADPFYGGRANMERPGVEGLEKDVGRRTGVAVETFRTTSRRKAEAAMFDTFDAEQPLMVYLDMGFLRYFGLPEDYHFGGHCIALVGYDPDRQVVLAADRDEQLHEVTIDELAEARGSTFRPFPPKHQWFEFDFSDARPIQATDAWEAIGDAVAGMLEPPISNIGIKGILKAGKETAKWPRLMDDEALRRSCINASIFIDATGGTGGGIFRYMYARFLEEAADLTGEGSLSKLAAGFTDVGDQWEEVAAQFRSAAEAEQPEEGLTRIAESLPGIAGVEKELWTGLAEVAADHRSG